MNNKKVVRRGFFSYGRKGCPQGDKEMASEQQRKKIDTAASETDHNDVLIGARLRHMRIASGLKLKDVAAAADCSESMLSKVETGHVSPSINMLHRITKVLNVNISGLFAPVEETSRFIQRQGTRSVLSESYMRHGPGLALERLTPYEIHGHLQGQLHVIAPGAASDGAIQHEGEEVGYVVEGSLELTVGDQTVLLGAGDSFFFDSSRPHSYRNPGKVVARVVWVNSPPSY
ncbi:cupin domain-containing protein [Hoeflea phototrophica]|nr:cupin domain-containing protein [Hoeflea phototrophica]